jgi:hypothetical protein
MLRGFLARLPLTDRVTFATEMVAALLYGVFSGLALPLLLIVAQRIGMKPEAITAMVTMQFVGALFGIVLGHLGDRLPPLPFAVWPALASRAAIGLLFFARTPTSFFILVTVYYLLVNLGGPAYGVIMRSNYSDANRGRLMGDIRIAIVIVSAAVSFVASLLLSRNEDLVWWIFPVAGAFGVVSSLAFSRIKVRRRAALPEAAPVPAGGSLRASLVLARRNAPLLVFLGLLFLSALPDKMSIPLEPIWLVNYLEINLGDSSLLLGTVANLASIVGYFVWARALKRARSTAVLAAVIVIFAGRYAALAAARSVAGLIPMSILSGLSNAGWDLVPIFCMIDLADRSNFSLSVGLSTTLFGLRGILGPSIGTLLYTGNVLPLRGIFWVIAGVILSGGVLMAVFSRGRPRVRGTPVRTPPSVPS